LARHSGMSMTPGATARPIASMRHVTDNALIEKVEQLFLAVVHAFPYMLRIGFAIHAGLFSSRQGGHDSAVLEILFRSCLFGTRSRILGKLYR